MKVLIAGYYGFKNLGDELILSKIIDDIRSIEKDAEIVVWSGDVEYTGRIQRVRAVDRFSIDKTVEAVKDTDYVITGGGGLIQEYYGIDVKDIFGSFGYNVPAYAIVPLLANIFQKPLFYWSHGIGPIFTKEGKRFTKWFYSLANSVTVRDKYSYNFIKELSPDLKNIYLDTDPVLHLNIDKFVTKKFSLSKDKRKIGINLRPWFAVDEIIERLVIGFNDIKDDLANIILVPIPFDLSLDKPIVEKFINKLEDIRICNLLEELNSAEDVISLINSVDCFIGTRLHSIVVSRLLKKPTLSISYDIKTDEFANLLGIQSIHLSDILKKSIGATVLNFINSNDKNEHQMKIEYKTPEIFKEFLKNG
ncbi:MAG: polysaccharide pyruvyl transferase CsaB [bacterium]|nr:MAG: polysaccharide pyruvyl transferase CsaB [bacterium]